ncbi:hypothetical protein B0T19DRAFT_474079 [Cercophora scortea]|uniref:Uncharacterized protein n=1 Tax=Cercophora scortea TaxID=314031 RepID=A0AAE0IY65_9PEZI|nr:hypothetical protein B0T19DRAFT_474079 [Cercophora scortea]
MDDAARLVSELQAKLAELDGKVAAYERGMLAEFHRHMVDCLKNCPEHVSNEVSRIIAESMSKYPALNSTSRDRPQSPASISVADRRIREGRKSPPPVLKHTSGTPVIRSPHEREKEFQGLFTPSYLPLLDSKDRVPHSPPISPLPAEPPLVPSSERAGEAEVPSKIPEAVKEEVRPAPVRRLTDRSSSSLESSGSETKVRRSALRRSSSSTKGSPRRVRFDFEGEEVFPSVDPLESVILDLERGDDGAAAAEAQPEADTSAITLENESLPAYTGTSLLDVEGEEDWLPKPKKVSSTQALQALTRSPLDEGTVWTVVDPESDETSSTMNGENKASTDEKVGASNPAIAPTKPEPRASTRAENSGARKRSDTSESLDSAIDEEDDEDTSDDEFLSMRPKSSGKTSMSPGTQSPVGEPSVTSEPDPQATPKGTAAAPDDSARTPTLSSTRLDEIRYQDEDEDALFEFEQEGGRAAPRPQTRRQKYLVEETDEDDEGGDLQSVTVLDSVTVSELRVVPEAAESTAPLELAQGTRIPPTAPSTVLFGNSVGSYKGHPLRINPINNQRLYDEIAGMKDVHFFVGSVEDDPESYRAGVSRAFAGTPRSFTERLALEEVMEKRKSDREAERKADRL